MTGRPSNYSQETADKICEELADGKSLRTICKGDDMPSCGTVFRWLAERESFQEQYTRARETQADAIADEIIQIADDASDPAKARVQIDARKWYAGKVKPKKYGDKVQNEHSGPDGGPIPIARVERVITRPNAPDPNR